MPVAPMARDRWLFGGLFLLTVTTGLVHATSFLGLGQVFTANMTGNVLFLGFAVTGSPAAKISHLSVVPTLLALAGFVAGALGGGALAGRRGRAPRLAVGFGAEGVLLVAAVSTIAFGSATRTVRDVAVILLGLSMGVQNAAVRRMGLPDVNTTVLTTTLGGLAADVVSIGGRPANAGRRVATVAFIFVGAAAGALLERADVTWSALGALVVMLGGVGALGRSRVFSSTI